ncbi:hypothetical protein J6590_004769, partial [Homalodisca vitripennis]
VKSYTARAAEAEPVSPAVVSEFTTLWGLSSVSRFLCGTTAVSKSSTGLDSQQPLSLAGAVAGAGVNLASTRAICLSYNSLGHEKLASLH